MGETTDDHEATPEVAPRWQDAVLGDGEEAQIVVPADEIFTIESKEVRLTRPVQIRIVRDTEAPDVVYATGESLGLFLTGEGSTVQEAVTGLIEIIQQEEATDAEVQDQLIGAAALVYERIAGLVVEVKAAE